MNTLDNYRVLYRRETENPQKFFERIIDSFQELCKKGVIKTESILTGGIPLCVYELKEQGAFLLCTSERYSLKRKNPDGVIRYLGASKHLVGLVDNLLKKEKVLSE